jgi:YidC/Oxa1 family membrane protein insertase
MDKRFLLALLLTAVVIVVTPMLFRDATRRPTSSVRPDTASQQPTAARVSTSSAAPSQVTAAPPLNSTKQTLISTATVDTTPVAAQRTSYVFSSRGAAPISVVLDSYPSRRPPLGTRRTELVQPHQSLMRYHLALGADTVSLDTISLQAVRGGSEMAPTLTYTGSIAGRPLQLAYAFASDSFLMRVSASVAGAPASSALLIDLPRTLVSNEPDTLDDMGHLAVSYRSHGEINSVGFSKLDSAVVRTETGPLDWVATRNKYFLVAYRSMPKHPFSALRLQGVPHTTKVASQAAATTVLPLASDGTASFDVYAGPQDFERLQRLGGDLDQVNPYAGWLHGVVQPFATIVMRALLWMKRTTNLN